MPIRQIFLSHPDEDYSLSLNQLFDDDGHPIYTATLSDQKASAETSTNPLTVETEVSEEVYQRYASDLNYPVLYKFRATTADGAIVDLYENGAVAKSENKPEDRLPEGLDTLRFKTEQQIYEEHYAAYGQDVLAFRYDSPAHTKAIAKQVVEYHTDKQRDPDSRDVTIMIIAGRSGSGKSTTIEHIQSHIKKTLGIDAPCLSLDDKRHSGEWLNSPANPEYTGEIWDNWDREIIYDADALLEDVETLMSGQQIPKWKMNYDTQRSESKGFVQPAGIILLDGLFLQKLHNLADLQYTLETPLATCIGRRLARDMGSDRATSDLPTPGVLLRYMLETAEKEYLLQQQAA